MWGREGYYPLPCYPFLDVSRCRPIYWFSVETTIQRLVIINNVSPVLNFEFGNNPTPPPLPTTLLDMTKLPVIKIAFLKFFVYALFLADI